MHTYWVDQFGERKSFVMDNSASECHPEARHGPLIDIVEESSGALGLEDSDEEEELLITSDSSGFDDEMDAETGRFLSPTYDVHKFGNGPFVDV